ncbi:hypothetical protein PI125_g14236 [Phytophthora idaei]|nr:hypothetical protein PI125_g14236 [Phytophthora idaei]
MFLQLRPPDHASWTVFDANLKEYTRETRNVLVVGETFNVGRRNAALSIEYAMKTPLHTNNWFHPLTGSVRFSLWNSAAMSYVAVNTDVLLVPRWRHELHWSV